MPKGSGKTKPEKTPRRTTPRGLNLPIPKTTGDSSDEETVEGHQQSTQLQIPIESSSNRTGSIVSLEEINAKMATINLHDDLIRVVDALNNINKRLDDLTKTVTALESKINGMHLELGNVSQNTATTANAYEHLKQGIHQPEDPNSNIKKQVTQTHHVSSGVVSTGIWPTA